VVSSACLLIVLAASPPPEIRLEEKASTRIFVRTVPPGAKIVLDGKPLGQSDGLFLVPPGVRRITVERDGFDPVVHEIDVREGRITPLEWKLRPRKPATQAKGAKPKPNPPAGEDGTASPDAASPADSPADAAGGSSAVMQLLSKAEITPKIREAMQIVLRQHPTESRWSGRAGPTLFAMAAKRLPAGQVRSRAVPAMLELVHMQATHELLTAKSLLDRFEATGLNDATTLRQAVEKAVGALHVTGNVQGVVHGAATVGEFAAGYVIADEAALSAYLLQPAELEIVRTAYRDVMHAQARQLMDRGDWQNALLLWQHLHQRRLVSQQLYLDAARCFKELKQTADTVRVLSEAIASFGDSGSPEFLERAGDLMLDVQTDEAQSLAETAYRKASDALKETISGVTEH